MKRSFLLTLLTLLVAVVSFADERDRHQSYISYDDGGTVIRSGDDGRELEAHRNMPIYPGDEVVTARRGRAEVRLSDGNIVGIDRTTSLKFRSILDSYEGESNETVAELRYGKVAVHRTDIGRDHVRLDTDNASYIAEHEAVYSVETDSRGRDRVTVFEGSLEVRTPRRATRLRRGESVTIDGDGLYELTGDQRESADDFERWFLKRADRFDNYNNRYVDRRLGYWADDLDDHGRWVFVTGIGWSWRPIVSVGWRPYHNGYWHHSRNGCLTWVSYDPWGWGTYHYGRWAYDPGFGWIWVPGYGYSPAWVYWTYGPGYVGWAPSGWWDCYRPYYSWAYHPYRNRGVGSFGFGFNGRVRVSELDLRPWTFVDSNVLISNRIDRAALTTDVIKQRLSRNRDGHATIGGGAARFTREELRDPAEAIRRRGLDGRMTGRETGAPPTDLTPFIRRDPEVGGAIRDRIARAGNRGSVDVIGGGTTGGTTSGRSRNAGGSGLAPIGGGNAAPIGRGSVAPIGGGSVAPIEGRRDGGNEGRVNRGGSTTTPPAQQPDPVRVIGGDEPSEGSTRGSREWRDRMGDRDRNAERPSTGQAPATTPSETAKPERQRNDSWRSRVRSDDGEAPRASAPSTDRGSSDRGSSAGSGDVPRRVIDGIGGARVVPRSRDNDGGSSGSSTRERAPRDNGGSRERARDHSGSSSGSRESARPSPPPPSRNEGSSGSSSRGSEGSSGGNRESGGRVKRDQ